MTTRTGRRANCSQGGGRGRCDPWAPRGRSTRPENHVTGKPRKIRRGPAASPRFASHVILSEMLQRLSVCVYEDGWMDEGWRERSISISTYVFNCTQRYIDLNIQLHQVPESQLNRKMLPNLEYTQLTSETCFWHHCKSSTVNKRVRVCVCVSLNGEALLFNQSNSIKETTETSGLFQVSKIRCRLHSEQFTFPGVSDIQRSLIIFSFMKLIF